MFTGLIEETGTMQTMRQSSQSLQLTIAARRVVKEMRLGDSIAVNGVCLTVVRFDRDSFTADVMPETYRRTNLRLLERGAMVNLERTMMVGDRFGGHIVQGHIDETGTIAAIKAEEIAIRVTVTCSPEILRYVVPQGSIAVDGISLTVAHMGDDSFDLSLIPHTVAATNMKERRVGEIVNLEVDILAKYVARMLVGRFLAADSTTSIKSGGITEAFLREHGFGK